MKKILILSGVLVLATAVSAGSGHKVKVHLKGMTCQSCARTIEKSVSKVPGVKECKVNLEKGMGIVIPEKGKKVSDAVIRKAVEKAGYKVAKIERE